jgi:hypothetical protein
MWKKVLGVAAVMLAAVLLITGIMAAVTADNADPGAPPPTVAPSGPPQGRGFGPALGGNMLEKVAAKLGIDKTRLEDAFKQVMLEEQQARTSDRFAAWVKDGKLTQAQADAYKAWIAQKPNVELPRPERPAGAPPYNGRGPSK